MKDVAHDGVPRSAIMTGAADFLLPVLEIREALVKFSRQAQFKPKRATPAPGSDTDVGSTPYRYFPKTSVI